MRPVTLEMTAFGSYARPTVIDFRELDHGLYLITGDTGAGKTTIFDGIMVALYGVASGKGDNKSRTFEIMHCDYVEKSVDTKVALSFTHMGKLYRVERTLHFKKKRETGAYEKTTPSACFWEPDREPIEKTEPVTKRITELLGMNAEQFRKIAMLAQGEFKKFLDADSEEKNKILGELFDSSDYVYFQDLFDAARKKLEQDRREKGTEQIRRVMEDFVYPEDMDEEARTVYTAGHPGLEKALCELADRDSGRREALRQQEQACRKRERELHEKKGRAEEKNRQLEELFAKQEVYKGLLEQREAMETLRRQVGKADRAFYKVKPRQDMARKAQKDYDRAVRETEENERKLVGLEEDRQNRKLAWEETKRAEEPVIAALAIRIDSLEKSMPRYGELEENRGKQQEERKRAQAAGEKKCLAEERKKQTEEEIDALKKEITELDGVDVRKERLLGELERAKENLDKLVSENGILAQAEKIEEREESLKKERKKLQELTAWSGELEARYHELYQAFLSGQAGILAKNLERELEERGEAVCPVCHTPFQGSHAHSFAKPGEYTPQKSEVDEARAAFDDQEEKRQKQSRKITELETIIRGEKESAVAKLRELVPACADWETLCGDGYLEEIEARYRNRKAAAKEQFSMAVRQSRRFAELKEKETQKEREAEVCGKELEESREEELICLQAKERLETAADALVKSLPYYEEYPDRESAARGKAAWEEEKKQRELRMEQASAVYNEADRKYEETRGILRAGRDALPKLEQEKKETTGHFREAMAQAGFADEAQVRRALETAGENDAEAERWIITKKEELTVYENVVKNTGDRIAELKELTKEQEKTDPEELDEEIRKQGEALNDLQEQIRLCEKQYDNHKTAAEVVEKANRTLKDTEAAWLRLDSLASLANGSNAAGGRLSFDRYVMGYVFREILEMANRRLDVMSGGRYELIHEMQARRGNAAAGLEVSVFDMTTGKSRPSQSLSGGESFFVSLALALGLSDVVQNRAGGKQLDALFIDEGFGSLDSDVLDRALSVLNRLTEGNRLVGIISHVARLEESIPLQIRVRNGENGSSLAIVR